MVDENISKTSHATYIPFLLGLNLDTAALCTVQGTSFYSSTAYLGRKYSNLSVSTVKDVRFDAYPSRLDAPS